jgi:HK97 family phage prohead protease/HK97 family phage major capsid protein
MLSRAYSCLEFKSLDDDKRVIEGLATSIETDRMGDIVEPKGAEFKLPLPLLWQHRADQPIGHVTAATVTKDGIKIKAQIAKDTGIARIDEAWQLIKSGLVRGLSIGFKSIESNRIDDTFGMRFLKWEWLELSAVTIPANAAASIALVKSLDAAYAPASGHSVRTSSSAGVLALPVVTTTQRRPMKKTITDQIRDFENTRAAKVAERDGIMEKAADAGETLDAAETETYDTLQTEIKAIDAHLIRLKDLEKENITRATPVVVEPQRPAVITVKDTMPNDEAFGAVLLCKAHSFLELQRGNLITPAQVAKSRYPSNSAIQAYFAKGAVPGGITTDTNYAASLFPPATVLESAFLEYLRPKTIIGRFGTGGIPSLKRVPFNVKIQSQTTAAGATWVGEAKPKLVTKFHTTDTTLLFTKVAAISVISDELARFARPGAETLVRDELARAVIERLDIDFIDPAKAVSSGVNPASITNGVTALTSAGVSAANVLTDVQNLINPFLLLNYDVSDLVLIMPNSLALVLSLMQNSLGQDSFKGMSVSGGTLAGLPVITSQYAGTSGYGNIVICASAGNIALADDGNVSVDASREASIEMVDSSSQDAGASSTGASLVSMFQTNSIAIRAEREINWKKLRSTAVTWMDDINWGSIGSPA